MKQRTTENAKRLIQIIGQEYEMASQRVAGGHIQPSQKMGVIYERLNRKALKDPDLRMFLDRVACIPTSEDEHMHYPWAEDPRDDSFHEVHVLDQERREEMPPEVRKLGKGGLL